MLGNQDHSDTDIAPTWRRWILAGVVVLLLLGLNAAYRGWRAVEAGTRGKGALVQAETQLNLRQPKLARQHLTDARAAFQEARREIKLMGPLLPLARITPFVRVQTRGVQAFADAGVLLSEAGIRLTDSASTLIEPSDGQRPVSDAVEALDTMHTELEGAVRVLATATARVADLNGYRLLGPIGDARDDLVDRLPAISSRAASAERGLRALLVFVGGSGPRRYLFFSQNPAEARPTGGFMGTYGLLVADGQGLKLERFESIDAWQAAHPDAVVPAEQAPTPLRYSIPPFPQKIANANAVADWPTGARLAVDLWRKGGEAPVDGVISVTPGFLRRVIAVLGPVDVPSYGETVNAATVEERFDFYTRQAENRTISNVVRKDFVAELAQVVMQRLLAAPASQWELLARSMGEAFSAREAMAWSTDGDVTGALAERRWDGALPAGSGDFFYGAEFQYETKNGRGLRRTYDHTVDVRPDGSARVTTVIATRNPMPRSPLNDEPVTYVTAYGPQGAVLDQASDPHFLPEATVAGHPAAGWFRGAPPLSESRLKVVWEVPRLVDQDSDGARTYRLHWMRIPDHTGDVLNLNVNLPNGWSWDGAAPPSTFALDADVTGAWRIRG